MSKILLGQSYYLRFDPKLWEAMEPYPPLGTLYAASVLREAGHDVALFDAMLAPSVDAWGTALEREAPQLAVLFEDNFNYLSKMCLLRMREAAIEMVGMARARGCPVIVCGSDATDHPATYLDAGADFVVVGEGEETLRELVERLAGRSSTPLEEIRGLAFRPDETSDATPSRQDAPPSRQDATPSRPGSPGVPARSLVRTPARTEIRDLDALPLPAWDLVDVPHYRKLWKERHGYHSMNMVTTRGCPYHCNWCAKPIWGQRYNTRSPANVVAELKWLESEFQPDHIWFMDDIMGLVPGWLEEFADRVVSEGVRTPFKCLSRADLLLRGEVVQSLRRAGCRTVWIGAESGSQKILDAMEKGTRVEQIVEATRRLREAGIQIGWFLQFGYPGEDREDIERTLRLVRDVPPDDIGVSVSYPLPGTKFHERVREQLGERRNWVDSNDLSMLYVGPYSTAFYRQLHKVVHKEFRARRTWRRLRAGLSEGRDGGLPSIRRIASMVYHAATLPLARRRLDRLADHPVPESPAVAPELDPAAASEPSLQDGSAA